jgi:hypothetical protein
MQWCHLPDSYSLENDATYNNIRLSRKEALRIGIIQEVTRDAPVHLSDLPEFQYTPLHDDRHFIRVLCLERPRRVAGYHRTTVPCASLLCIPLDEEASYVALSYVWGDASKRCPIILNDCVFWVTESLAGALERFHESDRILFLWADAVCINQKDLIEKGAQVQEMGNIYRKAQLVLGWIGPTADDSELALKSLAYIGHACATMPDGPCIQEQLQFFQHALPADDDDLDKAFPIAPVIALCRRPWWGRIWVVQEVVLSKSVHIVCGSSSLEFGLFSLAWCALGELPLLNANCKDALTDQIKPLAPIQNCQPRLIEAALEGTSKGPQPLIMRLLKATAFGATDPRDHIYALLGMASDTEELSILADYTKPCADSYTVVAAALLQSQQKLQILSQCRTPKVQKDLPSWVPDWSQSAPVMIHNPRYGLFSAGRCTAAQKLYALFTAGQNSLKQKLRVEGKILLVRGAIVGSVKKLGWSWNAVNIEELKDHPQLVRTGLGIISEFVSTNCTAYKTLKDQEDALWRTPIVDTECGLFGPNGRYNRRATNQMQNAFREFHNSSLKSNLATEQCKYRYIATMLGYLLGRRYFSLSTGHLGLGPLDVRTGDLVCTMVDGDVPFVIRQTGGEGSEWFQERSETQYQLVGECYIHGIMDGEFWQSKPKVEELILV